MRFAWQYDMQGGKAAPGHTRPGAMRPERFGPGVDPNGSGEPAPGMSGIDDSPELRSFRRRFGGMVPIFERVDYR